MVLLKHANDEKSTTGGREFHTFITLSAKKFLRAIFVVCGVLVRVTPCFLRACQMRKKIIKTDTNHAKNYFIT